MSRSSGELLIHTVPSTRVRATASYFSEPYQRIVGIEAETGDTYWDAFQESDPYQPSDATSRIISLTPDLADRTELFFSTFYAKPYIREKINCHFFALWILGSNEQPTGYDYLGEAVSMMRDADRQDEQRLGLGEVGIYGVHKGNGPKPEHVVIGLGEGCPEVLQVVAFGGHMAIINYEQAASYYLRFHDGDPTAGLYRPKQEIPIAGTYSKI